MNSNIPAAVIVALGVIVAAMIFAHGPKSSPNIVEYEQSGQARFVLVPAGEDRCVYGVGGYVFSANGTQVCGAHAWVIDTKTGKLSMCDAEVGPEAKKFTIEQNAKRLDQHLPLLTTINCDPDLPKP